jgi:hypothetical protein
LFFNSLYLAWMTSSLSVRMKFDAEVEEFLKSFGLVAAEVADLDAGVMQELDVAGGTGGDELQEVTAVIDGLGGVEGALLGRPGDVALAGAVHVAGENHDLAVGTPIPVWSKVWGDAQISLGKGLEALRRMRRVADCEPV